MLMEYKHKKLNRIWSRNNISFDWFIRIDFIDKRNEVCTNSPKKNNFF